MKLKTIGLLAFIATVASACSAPVVAPQPTPKPKARPVEVPVPRIKPRVKPKPNPPKPKPYSAKVERYSENVATRVEELGANKKQTSILGSTESEKMVDEESNRLDPYRSKSESKKSPQADQEDSGISTAVMTLMLRAKVDMLAGRNDQAIDKLERGLRIQPSNPDLWNKLAEAHYHGEDYTQAISMAKKSIRLTPKSNKSLLKSNWKLISRASKKAGDMDGMKAAMRAESSL